MHKKLMKIVYQQTIAWNTVHSTCVCIIYLHHPGPGPGLCIWLLVQFYIHVGNFSVKTYQSVNTLWLRNVLQDPACPVLHHLGTSGHMLPRFGECRGFWGAFLPVVDCIHYHWEHLPQGRVGFIYLFSFLLKFNYIMWMK